MGFPELDKQKSFYERAQGDVIVNVSKSYKEPSEKTFSQPLEIRST